MTTLEQPQLSIKEMVLMAFPQLMMEKGYTKITVQDILTRAQIGRTTFYTHFTSKEDVLKMSIGNLRDGLLNEVRIQNAVDGRLLFTLPYFEHIISHHKLYDDLAGRDDFFILERYFLRMLADLAGAELHSSKHTSSQRLRLEMIIQHLVGALWTTSIWWLERKQLSAEEVNNSFKKLMLPGLEQSLTDLLLSAD